MPLVILDVNVVTSATGPSSDDAPPARAVAAGMDGAVGLLVSPALIAEYVDVLRRARLRRWHGLSEETILRFVDRLACVATSIEPPPSPVACPDPGDQHLWDLLAAVPDAILVTGDRKLLDSQDFPGRIVSPRECVERYAL